MRPSSPGGGSTGDASRLKHSVSRRSIVALRSKYTRASSPGGGSSLARLVSRTPTGRTGPRPHREDWPLSALTPLYPPAARGGSRGRRDFRRGRSGSGVGGEGESGPIHLRGQLAPARSPDLLPPAPQSAFRRHADLTTCGETQAAQFSRWGLARRSIPAEPLRFAPFFVAFRSKYTRAGSPGGGSSLTRFVSRTPTGRTGPRPHRENWPVSALTRVPPQAVSSPSPSWTAGSET